jgi:two-component system chemotaxis sensor kinase CheA
MDMTRYRELFLSETREHLSQMSRLLVALEQAPDDRETIDALFREAHSVKGMAASMGYERTATLAHHLEDTLDGFRRGGSVSDATVDRLLAGLDLLEELLEDLQADRAERDIEAFLAGPAASPVPLVAEAAADDLPLAVIEEFVDQGPEEAAAEAAEHVAAAEPLPVGAVFQVTVNLAEGAAAPTARGLLVLRELEGAGEIISATPTRDALRQGGECRRVQAWLRTAVPRPRLEAALRAITDVVKVSFADDRRTSGGQRGAEAGRSVRVRTDLLDQVINLSGELLTRRFMLQGAAKARDWETLDDVLGQAARLIDELHRRSLQARLMSLESITGRLPRLVRDLARKSGKLIEFKLVGNGVALDRLILEELSDPLVHLVRNAIDHGIAEQGEVTVAARREKDLVLIEISDNGRGMDPAGLRRQAVERGVLTSLQAERLSDRESLMLICVPGFSTAQAVTETSGRGVGMDVVKAAIEKLGGTLDIHSVMGEGSRFQLRLPQSMAIIRILLVSCGGRRLALPVTRVQRTLELPRAEVAGEGHRRRFLVEGEECALVRLGDLLDQGTAADSDPLCVVLTETQGRWIGVQVDRFLGQRDAFVKPLGFPLNRLPGMSGATIEADGDIVFIIDPYPLLEGAAVQTASP